MEDLETQEEIQEEETDELDGLDAAGLEEEATIDIDGQPVKLSDVEKIYKDYSNDTNWKATNTQKAQEISQEKQRLDEERQHIEQLRRDAELLLQRQQYQPPQQQEQQDQYYGLSQGDFEELTPFEQTMLKKQYAQEKAWKDWQTENEKKEFYNQTQVEHQRLKGVYSDYDGSAIERAIIQGRNQFEDVHLAETFKRIKQGDPDTIKSFIPENILTEIKKQARNELIEDLRKKEAQRKKLATPTPEKGGLAKIPDSTPIKSKSYRDIRSDVLNTLQEEKISLFD